MLSELRIRNLVLIEDVVLRPGAGLNLLTGETGAGKSIIVESLQLLSGARTDGGCVRAGGLSALVEGWFDEVPHPARERAEQAGAQLEDGRLLLAREVGADGRTRAFLQGRSVPLSVLREIASELFDLHGQHQSRALARPESHREALDRFGRLGPLLERTGEAARSFHAASANIEAAQEALRSRRERLDWLRARTEEIAAAAPEAGQDARLREELQRVRQAARIGELSTLAESVLAEEEGACLGRLARASEAARALCEILPSRAPAVERLAEARYAIEDALELLRVPTGDLDAADPGRLDAMESRLARLESLCRRHDCDAAGLVALAGRFQTEIGSLESGEESLSRAVVERDCAAKDYVAAAGELSAARRPHARRLGRALSAELSGLAFRDSAVEVRVEARAEDAGGVLCGGSARVVSPQGWDRVEILFAPNPGEPPRPLDRIASGGELSRVMLALDVLESGGQAPTVIFDEIDAGIGGRTAEAVGARLAKLAASRQVLCVTHQPQIAARADRHWSVEKKVTGGRTLVTLAELDKPGRIEELTRMLSGSRRTQTATRHASEMLGALRPGPERAAPARAKRTSA